MGMTEGGILLELFLLVDLKMRNNAINVGKPIFGTKIWIKKGEIFFGGENLSSSFSKSVATGDMGHLDKKGESLF